MYADCSGAFGLYTSRSAAGGAFCFLSHGRRGRPPILLLQEPQETKQLGQQLAVEMRNSWPPTSFPGAYRALLQACSVQGCRRFWTWPFDAMEDCTRAFGKKMRGHAQVPTPARAACGPRHAAGVDTHTQGKSWISPQQHASVGQGIFGKAAQGCRSLGPGPGGGVCGWVATNTNSSFRGPRLGALTQDGYGGSK